MDGKSVAKGWRKAQRRLPKECTTGRGLSVFLYRAKRPRSLDSFVKRYPSNYPDSPYTVENIGEWDFLCGELFLDKASLETSLPLFFHLETLIVNWIPLRMMLFYKTGGGGRGASQSESDRRTLAEMAEAIRSFPDGWQTDKNAIIIEGEEEGEDDEQDASG